MALSRIRRSCASWVLGSLWVFGSGCGIEDPSAHDRSLGSRVLDGVVVGTPSPSDPGALVRVTMSSSVAVNLDELPASVRNRVATGILLKPTAFWVARAKAQAELTGYRLTYRNFFYGSGSGTSSNKQMMPITTSDQWNITLGAAAQRTTLQGHDVISVPYTLTTTILTDVDSPGTSEPKLKAAGGLWDEPYQLPIDPELLFARTGYACVDEDGYPPNTADSENSGSLYDHTCGVEVAGNQICHLTFPLPTESCLDAVTNHIGRVDTQLHFERLVWNATLANQVRVGTPTQANAPDLTPVQAGLADNRIIYRYIAPNSCSIAEQCVGGSGWRRLLQFTASVKNQGAKPLAVGGTDDPNAPLRVHNVFEFSPCHGHFHFSHYGEFKYGALPGEKRAFCLESTTRWFNSEVAPLAHPFSCHNQGIAAGWGDDYIAGTECQWIDITSLPTPSTAASTFPLSFQSNPDRFLCEGTPVTDSSGALQFEATSFVTEAGLPVDRPLCSFAPNTQTNNFASLNVTVPRVGGYTTAPCTRDQQGPLRDCGFKEQPIRSCTPGAQVTLSCTKNRSSNPPQVVRICEASAALGGTSCVYRESIRNTIVDAATTLTFTCPTSRDANEPGGKYSLYQAPVVDGDLDSPVICN